MDEKEISNEVNIEEIMQQIRSQILAQKTAVSAADSPIVTIDGKRLSPEFYEHLYQAALIHDQIDVRMQVSEINVPVVGAILTNIRGKFHELVLFYVNKMAAKQMRFNIHILQALNLMAKELENEDQREKV